MKLIWLVVVERSIRRASEVLLYFSTWLVGTQVHSFRASSSTVPWWFMHFYGWLFHLNKNLLIKKKQINKKIQNMYCTGCFHSLYNFPFSHPIVKQVLINSRVHKMNLRLRDILTMPRLDNTLSLSQNLSNTGVWRDFPIILFIQKRVFINLQHSTKL